MKPFSRSYARGSQFIRQWQLLLLLRRGRRRADRLARELGVCERTVRRDLGVLRAAGLPIRCVETAASRMWTVGGIPEWPRAEVVPVRPLRGMELR